MEDPKFFRAFLNGVSRNVLLGEKDITPQYLKDELFNDQSITVEELTQHFQNCARILKKSAFENWEIPQLEKAIVKLSFSDMQQKTILRFWRAQRVKVHDALRSRSRWNNSLKKFSWRIDVKTKTKNSKENLNDPIAIIEMAIGKEVPQADDGQDEVSVLRFEMDRNQLAEILVQIKTIENQITSMQ
eukprot:TRINITY_DN750_c0_g1_i1.p1 TRINITY_DN750_c0_g1~~TRINITY_DN750_c0_g1_i1.p1  ORF type:complete len:187 (+),score=38.79 TRINITY_DN750_c0_g1_i1:82-642(+)